MGGEGEGDGNDWRSLPLWREEEEKRKVGVAWSMMNVNGYVNGCGREIPCE